MQKLIKCCSEFYVIIYEMTTLNDLYPFKNQSLFENSIIFFLWLNINNWFDLCVKKESNLTTEIYKEIYSLSKSSAGYE